MKEMRNNRKQDTAVVHGVEISYKLRKTVEGSGPPGDMAAVDPRDRKIVKSLPKLEENDTHWNSRRWSSSPRGDQSTAVRFWLVVYF